MSEIERGIATAKRERFWAIHDNVPGDQLTAGCQWCEAGWATGPGLVYRCDNCNPGTGDDPHTFHTESEYEPPVRPSPWVRLKAWWHG